MVERTAAVVLAAGAASRFGGGKLLATIGGRPILQHVLDTLADAGLIEVVVVLGDDAPAIESVVAWRAERRVRNPDPAQGLSSSLAIGMAALDDGVDHAVIVLGDQPDLEPAVVRRLLDAAATVDRPIVAPRYEADAGRNPVVVGRSAFALIAEATGDRGLGPVLAAHPELVHEVPVGVGANPDIDTRADLVARLEAAWAARVGANNAQVDRHREVPDGTDFYAPVTSLFRADPTRMDEPVLQVLAGMLRPGETWLDIGAGAGRYALPLARALATSGGSVVAVDPVARHARRPSGDSHGARHRQRPGDRRPLAGCRGRGGSRRRRPHRARLIRHRGHRSVPRGDGVGSRTRVCRRAHGAPAVVDRRRVLATGVAEARVALPALPEFVELLAAHGRAPLVERLEREPRRFGSREELAGFLRRQLWLAEGSAADARFLAALDTLVEVDEDGGVGLIGQRPLPIGVVTWAPR